MKRAGIVVSVLVLLLAMIAGGVYLYGCFFSPLSRLNRDLKVGDPYSEAHEKFISFYERHKGQNNVQFSDGVTINHIKTGPISPTKHLFLYYQGVMDDQQLQVLFDASDIVKEIVFIGD